VQRSRQFLSLFLVALIIIAPILLHNVLGDKREKDAAESRSVSLSQEMATATTKAKEETTTAEVTLPENVLEYTTSSKQEKDFKKALFIGDSRVVGLQTYGYLKGATFFASVGLHVADALTAEVELKGSSAATLPAVLENNNYNRIYIMLGINDLQTDPDTLGEQYQEIVSTVRKYEPKATIYIMANLHITAEKSGESTIINNTAIDYFNYVLQKMADGKKIRYLDVNPLFDDASGALTADYTGDGIHLYPKYYPAWVAWLADHS